MTLINLKRKKKNGYHRGSNLCSQKFFNLEFYIVSRETILNMNKVGAFLTTLEVLGYFYYHDINLPGVFSSFVRCNAVIIPLWSPKSVFTRLGLCLGLGVSSSFLISSSSKVTRCIFLPERSSSLWWGLSSLWSWGCSSKVSEPKKGLFVYLVGDVGVTAYIVPPLECRFSSFSLSCLWDAGLR